MRLREVQDISTDCKWRSKTLTVIDWRDPAEGVPAIVIGGDSDDHCRVIDVHVTDDRK